MPALKLHLYLDLVDFTRNSVDQQFPFFYLLAQQNDLVQRILFGLVRFFQQLCGIPDIILQLFFCFLEFLF